MNFFNLIDVNALSIVILAFIFFDARRRAEKPTGMQHKLFISMVYILALLLVADSLGRSFDGLSGHAYYMINMISNVILYILVPAAPALWSLYAIYQISRDAKKLLRPTVLVSLVVFCNAVATVLSIHTGWFFSIDVLNIYHRGPLFTLHMAISFAVSLYPLTVVLLNRNQLDKGRFYTLLLFPIPTIIGGVLQSVFYGTSLIWCCMTVSMLFIYLNIQAERLGTDYLTGVFNRRQLDEYVKDKIQTKSSKKAFSVIMIDIDNFKKINDTFGHSIGDQALLTTTTLLKSCLRRGDFISRTGGDEFLIVLDIDNPAVLDDAVKRLRECFYQFNQTHTRPYTLSFSAGCAIYQPEQGLAPEQFIEYVDMLMYQDKKAGALSRA